MMLAMNPMKVAALIALLTAIASNGYFIYQATAVRERRAESVRKYWVCKTGQDAAAANWDNVQRNIDILQRHGQYKQALEYARIHEGERPVQLVPCSFGMQSEPQYFIPGAITVLGLIVSFALFGSAKSSAKQPN